MEVIDRILANQEKKNLPRLFNASGIEQSEYAARWRTLGYEISPEPLIPFKDQTEEQIFKSIMEIVRDIKAGGYDAILIGAEDYSIYFWYVADFIGMKVIRARVVENKLIGYAEVLQEGLMSIWASRIIPDEEFWKEERVNKVISITEKVR